MSFIMRFGPGSSCRISPALLLAAVSLSQGGQERVYIGTYTSGTSLGIYQSSLDLGQGTLGVSSLAGKTGDPSFIALHPSGNFLYAVNENGAAVVAFSVNRTTGALTLLNHQGSGGAGPCHVVVDSSGSNVLVANYTGGSVTVFPVQADGRLGVATSHIQHPGTNPHAHCVTLDASNHFALVCDLGLDRIFSYQFDPVHGALATNSIPWTSVPAGSGPRHLAFDPQYQRAYVICELSSTIMGFHYDSQQGALSGFQTISSIPAGWNGINAAAEIAIPPSGRFLYGSNRGYNSIAVFSVDPVTGVLSFIQQQTVGKTPRHFAIDPTGTLCLVADQDSDDVRVYAINAQTGLLSPTGQTITVSKPVCLLPLITVPPQPMLGVSSGQPNVFQVQIGNGLSSLTYQLEHALSLGTTNWSLLATGSRGQTNFTITNAAPQGFFRSVIVTNY